MEDECQSFESFARWAARRSLISIAVLLACCTNVPDVTSRDCDAGVCAQCAGRGDAKPVVQDTSGSPVPPPPTVSLPQDGFTNLTEVPAISISTIEAIDRSVLEQLANNTRLLAESTSAVIATEARISEREVRLAPKQPLEGGWYVLEVAALPSPLRWPDRPEFPIQNGIGRSRFRVGSEPHVMRIVLCEKAEHRTKLQVVVSEEVVVNEPVRDHLTVESADGPVRCDFSLSGGELTALCDLTCIESVKLTLDGAFATVSQPSSPAAAATAEFEFSPAALPTVETGCKALKAM